MTAVFQTFSGQNYFFFEAFCSSLCEHKHYRIGFQMLKFSIQCILLFQIPNGTQIFPDFSIPMIIFKTFQGLENFYIKFQDFPYFSRICTNPVQLQWPLLCYCQLGNLHTRQNTRLSLSSSDKRWGNGRCRELYPRPGTQRSARRPPPSMPSHWPCHAATRHRTSTHIALINHHESK